MNTIRLAIASLWRMKRRTMTSVWLRARMVNSRSTGSGLAPGCGPDGTLVRVGLSFASVRRLVITNPRVEYAVHQVGDQVEDDDDHGGDEKPGRHRVCVAVADTGEEEVPHPMPLENGLGQDGAAEDSGQVERHHGCQRDERRPQRVPDHNTPTGQA